MSKLEVAKNAYYRLPVFMQNLAISSYGWKLKRVRYGRNSDRYLSRLRQSEKIDESRMRTYIFDQFRYFIMHAFQSVPFYQRWSADNAVAPEEFRSIKDLGLLPILDKEAIRSNPNDFVSTDVQRQGRLKEIGTSGTSGKPLTIFFDSDSRTFHYAFWRRLRLSFGLEFGARRATLFGRVIMRADQDKRPFWRLDRSQNILLMSSYHLSERNLSEYYKALVIFRPEEVIGYPSSVYQISQFIVSKRLKPLAPRVVFLTAESFLPHQRKIIERAFDCPVINQYGCSEMAFFAAECDRGSMHFHPEHGLVEILDDNDLPVELGRPGSVVATGFVNRAMPLLRYRVGDTIAMSNKTCGCGRPFPIISMIEGRIDDVITTPDGRPIGRLDPVLKGRRGIIETQIAQIALDRLEVRVVFEKGFDANSADEIVSELRLRIGKEMKIEIVQTGVIPRGPNGKFAAVVREF